MTNRAVMPPDWFGTPRQSCDFMLVRLDLAATAVWQWSGLSIRQTFAGRLSQVQALSLSSSYRFGSPSH